jgi:hypothetical protein
LARTRPIEVRSVLFEQGREVRLSTRHDQRMAEHGDLGQELVTTAEQILCESGSNDPSPEGAVSGAVRLSR